MSKLFRVLVFTMAVSALLLSAANADVVGLLTEAEDSESEALGLNRYFIFNGWSKSTAATTPLTASDGNVHAGLTLDPNDPTYNSGGNGAGPSWQLERSAYEAVLGHAVGTGNVIRFSAWLAMDANDPLMNQGTWTDSIKFEFNSSIGNEVFERLIDPAPDLFPNTCDLGAGTCADPGYWGVNSSDWVLASGTYEIDAADPLATVTIVEPVIFIGDYTGSETEQGTLYLDNLMVEVFEDMAAANATAIPNPNPGGIVPEPATMWLMLMATLAPLCSRGRSQK